MQLGKSQSCWVKTPSKMTSGWFCSDVPRWSKPRTISDSDINPGTWSGITKEHIQSEPASSGSPPQIDFDVSGWWIMKKSTPIYKVIYISWFLSMIGIIPYNWLYRYIMLYVCYESYGLHSQLKTPKRRASLGIQRWSLSWKMKSWGWLLQQCEVLDFDTIFLRYVLGVVETLGTK